MSVILYMIIQLVIIIGLAPLVNGIIKKVKALSQKRKGAPVLQMYYDIGKLIRKDMVVSETSSWIFRAAPYVVFASTAVAAVLVPVIAQGIAGGTTGSIMFAGDVIVLIYTLALGRFFLMLAGLDTGSTFGGMGSSREGMISALMEPSVLVGMFTIGLVTGTLSIGGMMDASYMAEHPFADPVYIVIFIAMMCVLLAETCRIPVDDPSTHLELTMVHEAMILEYSGRQLALMELAAAMKQLVLMTFIANIFFPVQLAGIELAGVAGMLLMLILYVARIAVLSVVVAVIEICTVKLKLFSVPNLAALAFILSLLGFINYFVLGR